MRQTVIHTQAVSGLDDLRFGQVNQRSVNLPASRALDASLRGQGRSLLEAGDEFRTAIGIAAVINCIDPDKDVGRSENFRPAQGERQKDGVPGGDVGDRDTGSQFGGIAVFRHFEIRRQSRSAKWSQVDVEYDLPRYAQGVTHATGGVEFEAVPLSVVERQGVRGESLRLGNRQHGGGIEPTADQYDSRPNRVQRRLTGRHV